MADFLGESGRRAARPALVNTVMLGASAKYQQDIDTMQKLVDESRSMFKSIFGHFLIARTSLGDSKGEPNGQEGLAAGDHDRKGQGDRSRSDR